ncbi:MAG: Crp/Fnr family transcriptional regulator [Chitinophagales bacterium]
MEQKLIQLLRYVYDFDEQNLQTLLPYFKPVSVKKNDVLLQQGAICKNFYFVIDGCIRTYFISKEGYEKTRYIMLAPSMGTALTSFINQQPTAEILDALEDSSMFAIDYSDFNNLVSTMPQWAQFYQRILEMAYTFQNKKIESLVTLSAKQRYQQLMHENPAIIQTVSNKIVASYLDMAQETLSRLKSK